MYESKREEQLLAYCKASGLDRDKVYHFSASDLIKPPRMKVLAKRHIGEMVKDVSQEVFRLLGQAIHYMLREAAIRGRLDQLGYKAEERLFTHLEVDGRTVVVSGEPDIVGPDNRIQDYKVTAVYSWTKGPKKEWEFQTNVYAFLRTCKGLVNQGIDICFILRDWNLNETVQEGYPQAGAMMAEIPLGDMVKVRDWIVERVKLHFQTEPQWDDELPECTGYAEDPTNGGEMWEKPEAYAIIREGGKVASKVLTPKHCTPKEGQSLPDALREEAFAKAAEWNQKPAIVKGKEKPYEVHHRPGERTRCLRFCDVRQFCNSYKEYVSATMRGPWVDRRAGPTENVSSVE